MQTLEERQKIDLPPLELMPEKTTPRPGLAPGRASNAVFPHCLKSGRGYRRRGGDHRRDHCSFHGASRECAGV